jgi:dienelactone hydrolase
MLLDSIHKTEHNYAQEDDPMKKVFLVLVFISLMFLTVFGCKGNTPKTDENSLNSLGFREEAIKIGAGTEYELDGILTIPGEGDSPFPAVILVQGSGPLDKDVTLFSNKPFKDIADSLTTKGIAVLRFDKRTYTYQRKIAADYAGFTVKEEIIDDVILAANLLKADPRIDKDKVFVIGHSLGGMIAPRIDAEGGDFAGIIILAGSPRSLLDIMFDQRLLMMADLTGHEKVLFQAEHDYWTKITADLKDMSDQEAKELDLGFASGYYFKELDDHPAEDYLSGYTKPILILHGDKDFQVYTDKDYNEYQTLLKGKENAAFKLYPGLNHFFMTSTTGTVEEYKVNSHVDLTVLKDIADWIHARS